MLFKVQLLLLSSFFICYNPGNAQTIEQCNNNLSFFHEFVKAENYDAAIADYKAAIDRFVLYDEAYQSLGYAYYKTEQFDQALDNLNQALEIAPDSPIAHLYLGLVYLAMDQPDEALTATSQGVDSIASLPEEEQEAIITRILDDIERFAQENPDKAEMVDTIIDLIPAQ